MILDQQFIFSKQLWFRLFVGLIIIFGLIILYHYIFHVGLSEIIADSTKLRTYIEKLGYWGPIAIILFMAMAIVMSPIPSAPIAIAAGTLYGHTLGTLYIVTGAQIGAIIAFTISRFAGYELLKKWFGNKLNTGIFKSQKHLALIVFFSRLIPFISFDIISYAAGLTPISFFKFFIATFFGILPISFLLAHYGSNLGNSDPQKIINTIFALSFVTIIPIVMARWIKNKHSIK